jgi:hypothetical protein
MSKLRRLLGLGAAVAIVIGLIALKGCGGQSGELPVQSRSTPLSVPPGWTPNPNNLWGLCGLDAPPNTTIDYADQTDATLCGGTSANYNVLTGAWSPGIIINPKNCNNRNICCVLKHESQHALQQQAIINKCVATFAAAADQQECVRCTAANYAYLMEAYAYNLSCAYCTSPTGGNNWCEVDVNYTPGDPNYCGNSGDPTGDYSDWDCQKLTQYCGLMKDKPNNQNGCPEDCGAQFCTTPDGQNFGDWQGDCPCSRMRFSNPLGGGANGCGIGFCITGQGCGRNGQTDNCQCTPNES